MTQLGSGGALLRRYMQTRALGIGRPETNLSHSTRSVDAKAFADLINQYWGAGTVTRRTIENHATAGSAISTATSGWWLVVAAFLLDLTPGEAEELFQQKGYATSFDELRDRFQADSGKTKLLEHWSPDEDQAHEANAADRRVVQPADDRRSGSADEMRSTVEALLRIVEANYQGEFFASDVLVEDQVRRDMDYLRAELYERNEPSPEIVTAVLGRLISTTTRFVLDGDGEETGSEITNLLPRRVDLSRDHVVTSAAESEARLPRISDADRALDQGWMKRSGRSTMSTPLVAMTVGYIAFLLSYGSGFNPAVVFAVLFGTAALLATLARRVFPMIQVRQDSTPHLHLGATADEDESRSNMMASTDSLS